MSSCIFCKIASGDVPSTKIHEDDFCFAIRDISPLANQHVLVIPKIHCTSLIDAKNCGVDLDHLLNTTAELAKKLGLDASGFRTVINTGAHAGQTVFHLHVHLLGGQVLGGFS